MDEKFKKYTPYFEICDRNARLLDESVKGFCEVCFKESEYDRLQSIVLMYMLKEVFGDEKGVLDVIVNEERYQKWDNLDTWNKEQKEFFNSGKPPILNKLYFNIWTYSQGGNKFELGKWDVSVPIPVDFSRLPPHFGGQLGVALINNDYNIKQYPLTENQENMYVPVRDPEGISIPQPMPCLKPVNRSDKTVYVQEILSDNEPFVFMKYKDIDVDTSYYLKTLLPREIVEKYKFPIKE